MMKADAAPTAIHTLASIIDRLDEQTLFAQKQPLEVEIGAGDGSFLANYAAANPRHNFIGIERLLGRLRKIDRKGRRAGLQNLALLRIEAAYFIEYLLPSNAVQAIHIYFPDPWPKKKHRRHRLIAARFPEIARQVLVPDGTVYLRTDDADYFAQMQEVFASALDSFDPIATPPELAAFTTDFERSFNARGIATLRAAYRLK